MLRMNRPESRTSRRLTVLSVVLVLAVALLAPAAVAKATVDRIEGPFVTVVPTAFADNPAGVELMFAECDFVQRVEKPNGSAVENQHCQLLAPFVVFPGEPPSEAFTNTAGECIWFSDYHDLTSGDMVWAESVRLTVTPSGQVSVTTRYPAEPLEC